MPKISPQRFPQPKNKQESNSDEPASSAGFSLIELICVLSGITLLTAIAATTIQNSFREFEMDETQAHLNSAANDCLRALSNLKAPEKPNSKNLALDNRSSKPDTQKNIDYPYLIDAIDDRLLEKNRYKINSNFNNCFYFQIDPIDANSKEYPSLGFGIYSGKVTKFGISPSNKDYTQARDACERWAGEKCVEAATQSYDKFYTHMTRYKYNREVCELRFRKRLTKRPQSKTAKRWDATGDQDCNNEQPVQNSDTNYKNTCSTQKCNKKAYIFDGKFTGYSKSSQSEAQSTACSVNVAKYINQEIKINGSTYDGYAIANVDIPNCTKPISICAGKQYSDPEGYDYKECEIELNVSRCKVDLEERRKDDSRGNGEYIVGEGKLSGLPPCGQKVWIKNKVIYDKNPSSDG